MKTPLLHCLILLLISMVIFIRYARRNYAYWMPLIKHNDKYDANLLPEYMKDDIVMYYNKKAVFKRVFAAFILFLPIIIGTTFIIICSVDYSALTNTFFNSWRLLFVAGEIAIKNDSSFYTAFGVISLGIILFILFVCVISTKNELKKISDEQKCYGKDWKPQPLGTQAPPHSTAEKPFLSL